MALTLDARRPISEALGVLLDREFEQALSRLDQACGASMGDRVEGVHEFRRSVKRLRAAVSLLQGVAPAREHAAIDRALGDAARRLGTLRDAHARMAAAERVVRLLPRTMRALGMDAWRATGGAVSEAAAEMSPAAVHRLIKASRLEMEALRERVRGLGLRDMDARVVATAVSKAWGRARDRFRAAWKDRDGEWLHGVRKRTQRCGNLLALVGGRGGTWGSVAQRRLRKAAGWLGEARDAELMLERLPEQPAGSPLHAVVHRLRLVARRHAARCLRQARREGNAAVSLRRGEVRKRLAKALGKGD